MLSCIDMGDVVWDGVILLFWSAVVGGGNCWNIGIVSDLLQEDFQILCWLEFPWVPEDLARDPHIQPHCKLARGRSDIWLQSHSLSQQDEGKLVKPFMLVFVDHVFNGVLHVFN